MLHYLYLIAVCIAGSKLDYVRILQASCSIVQDVSLLRHSTAVKAASDSVDTRTVSSRDLAVRVRTAACSACLFDQYNTAMLN